MGASSGFTASDFDDLVGSGRITITREGGSGALPGASSTGSLAPAPVVPSPRRRAPAAGVPPALSAAVVAAVRAALAALSAEPMTTRAAMSGGMPDAAGLYALYGSPVVWKALGLGARPEDGPLYVGKSRT